MRQAEGGGLAWPMQPPLAASPTPTEAEPLSHPQRQQKKSRLGQQDNKTLDTSLEIWCSPSRAHSDDAEGLYASP